MGDTEADVLVVGAGPAGAAAARTAAAAGLHTVLVEKRGPPRDKVCGGLLTPACQAQVQRVFGRGVPSEVQIPPSPLAVHVVPPGGRADAFVLTGAGVLNVSRRHFDAWLDGLAEDEGTDLWPDTELLTVERDKSRFVASLRTAAGLQRLRASSIVGADGVYSRVREGIAPRSSKCLARYIQEYHPRRAGLEDQFHLFYRGEVSPFYAYAVPKGERLCLGIGVHAAIPPTLADGMARFKAWLGSEFGYHDSPPLSREGFSVPFGGLAFGQGRSLLAGDAAGLCYPPTGEGVTFAIMSGAEAARAIASDGENAAKTYAKTMSAVAQSIEAAVRRTWTMTDEERSRRIAAKMGP